MVGHRRGAAALAMASLAGGTPSDLPQEFPTPILPKVLPNTGLFLRIRGDWTNGRAYGRRPCITALPTGKLATAADFSRDPPKTSETSNVFHKTITLGETVHESFPLLQPRHKPASNNASHANTTMACAGHVLWDDSDLSQYLQVEVLRPTWTFTQHPQPGTIWYVDGFYRETPIILGELLYYPVPTVKFLSSVVHIGVRTFLNPGWRETIHLSCTNCTEFNRLVVRQVEFDLACSNPKLRAKMPQCKPSTKGSCVGYTGGAFQTAGLTEAGGTISHGKSSFVLESQRRLQPVERRHAFHRRMALCLYTDEAAPRGVLVGYAQLKMDGADVQAFVAFVCFFGVALPLICMVTVLLHANKQRRCKQQLRILRLEYQRSQLERELIDRRSERATVTGSV